MEPFVLCDIVRDAAVPFFETSSGVLYDLDCMELLPKVRSSCVDVVFADPPFNLGKRYGERSEDDRPDYIGWCRAWLGECVRALAPGGALFLYNLPKWNVPLGAYLMETGMELRHWIAVEQTGGFPIRGRLYPAHYSLLYMTKGAPATFCRIRTPIPTCRSCGAPLKDYGGHKKKMNPGGVTLKDIWTDISVVRHAKYKSSLRSANMLSSKLIMRALGMSTRPGDIVLDPFMGSGTTAVCCERMGLRWLGTDIDYAGEIKRRLETGVPPLHETTDRFEPPSV